MICFAPAPRILVIFRLGHIRIRGTGVIIILMHRGGNYSGMPEMSARDSSGVRSGNVWSTVYYIIILLSYAADERDTRDSNNYIVYYYC